MGNGTSSTVATEGGTLEAGQTNEEWGACSALLMDSSSFRCGGAPVPAERRTVCATVRPSAGCW